MGALKVAAGCGAMVSLHFLLRVGDRNIGKDLFYLKKAFFKNGFDSWSY